MRKHRSDAGFTLAALIFFVTAVSIVIAAIVPAYQMQAKREMEEELLFRGGEYTRAIQKYQRRFGVYPSSVDQLVQTNGLRFLRRKYEDPITGKEFRVIILNPDGSLTGSKTFTQQMNNQPLFGNVQQFGGGNNNNQGNNNLFGNPNNTNPTSTNPRQGTSTNPLGNSNSPISGGGNPSTGGFGGTNNTGRPGGTTGTTFSSPLNQGTNPATNQPGNSGIAGSRPVTLGGTGNQSGNQSFGAGGIIGVASDSEKDSIKIVNNYKKYDEWEFIAILNQQNGVNPNGMPNQGNNPPGQNPTGNNPTGNNPQGFNPAGRGFGGGSPFGGAPGSPLNPTPGQMPQGGGNPFGTPQTTQPRR